MNTNRIYCEAAKSSSLNTSAQIRRIPIDRNMKLESVLICPRSNITADNTNYSKIQFKNGSTVIAERSFQTDDLAADTSEALAISGTPELSALEEIQVYYVAAGNGLAIDLDCLLVLSPARG